MPRIVDARGKGLEGVVEGLRGVGDIGGTNARFAVAENGSYRNTPIAAFRDHSAEQLYEEQVDLHHPAAGIVAEDAIAPHRGSRPKSSAKLFSQADKATHAKSCGCVRLLLHSLQMWAPILRMSALRLPTVLTCSPFIQ
jgi:hypothetical protein